MLSHPFSENDEDETVLCSGKSTSTGARAEKSDSKKVSFRLLAHNNLTPQSHSGGNTDMNSKKNRFEK